MVPLSLETQSTKRDCSTGLQRRDVVQSASDVFLTETKTETVWNAPPAADVDFTSLARLRHSILKVDRSDFFSNVFNLHI